VSQTGGVDLDGEITVTAFLWSASKGKQDLGALLSGGSPGDHNKSWATGINVNGEIVGTSNNAGSYTAYIEAFFWTSAGGMEGLGMLSGGNYSGGNAISAAGQVVGW
jgi:probable HAF family extracellular repeat protein